MVINTFKFIIYVLLFSLAACGTHGSIKGYNYATNKSGLQKAVMTVIQNNFNIYRDTSLDRLGISPALDSNKDGDYITSDNYYSDINHYVTIKISIRKASA